LTTLAPPFPVFAVSVRIDGAEAQVGLHVVYAIDTTEARLVSDAPEDAPIGYFAPMLQSSTQPPTLCGQPLYSNRHAAEAHARALLDTAIRYGRRVRAL
jgi:hypothetical protein